MIWDEPWPEWKKALGRRIIKQIPIVYTRTDGSKGIIKMNELKIEVGKAYKLKNGYKGHVTAILDKSAASSRPVLGYITSPEGIYCRQIQWTADGIPIDGYGTCSIIEEWKEPKSGEAWVNVYDHGCINYSFNDTKTGAENEAKRSPSLECLARIKINWAEGQFDD